MQHRVVISLYVARILVLGTEFAISMDRVWTRGRDREEALIWHGAGKKEATEAIE